MDTLDELEQLTQQILQKPRKGRRPGTPGRDTRNLVYACSVCSRDVGRDNLFARQVTWLSLATLRRSRTRRTGWVCRECMEADPDYNLPTRMGAPNAKE